MTVTGRPGEGAVFSDRQDAGRRLASLLEPFRGEHPIVLALPRGGVPVAAEIAGSLGAPLDVIVVRKLGMPFHPELGFGAIGEHGVRVFDPDLIRRTGLTKAEIASVEREERQELMRRVRRYRGERPPTPIRGRTVIIVDDGLATGATARAAVQVARAQGAGRVIVAVPVAPRETIELLGDDADQVICLVAPPDFRAVGLWYRNFEQTSDEEVATLLGGVGGATPRARRAPFAGVARSEVTMAIDRVELGGVLQAPPGAMGVVIFAHGSGSSRLSPRNAAVADALHRRGLGTLLFDLLTATEADDRRNVFDIELLGSRLLGATDWVLQEPEVGTLPLGYFGASTGAAAALWAAGAPGNPVSATVSRGGRPDLAGTRLSAVRCPTLLIVGGLDHSVLEFNRESAERLSGCQHRLVVVEGASHLFEEPGTIEKVAELAGDWFTACLTVEKASV